MSAAKKKPPARKAANVRQDRSAAAPSPFPPIADFAFLSDCHTGALVAPDGAIGWLCVPRFDAPSVFGCLLDREPGSFRFGPFGIYHSTTRIYEPGTNVLTTTWKPPSGQRSALAIKGLTYTPTGAAVAALTTSLPETPGGERNWDYRYTWMRDATFMLQALYWLDLDWEADEFMQFVADVAPTDGSSPQIMYGIDGRRGLSESTRDDLSGYAGARPVRIGNAAFSQRQNDVFDAVLDSILLHAHRNERLPRRLWPIVASQAACATRIWRDPDQGIWEARGKPQHFVSSKLMCWVALDRASKLAQIRGDQDAAATWRATADEIQADVLTHGVSKRGVLRQHYETDALDASTLLAASLKFLAHDDERLRNTVFGVSEELTENGFVLRYRPDETDDGLSGNEGTFVICSFWLVSAFAIVGEMQRARDLMERLLRIASPLGLYAEEYDPTTGRHLGNFPQAFSHLALIDATARMILLEMRARL